MNIEKVLGFFILIAILAGIIGYAALRPAPAKTPDVAGLTLPAGKYVEHAAYYDIIANYASSTPLQEPANTAAIALMQKFVSDTITQFKTDGNFASLTAQDVKVMGFDQGKKEMLQITYLIASSGRTVSYIFTTYEDTLGAHSNTFFHTFTFDTDPSTSSGQAGAALGLADIFSTSDYLNTLSSLARARLPGVIGDSYDMTFINDGTTPDDKNFAAYFFDNKDFVVLFAPYAVAPYSAGPQTLRIPLSDLSSILKPEYK